MKDLSEFFVLKLNRNGFPNSISRLLKDLHQNEDRVLKHNQRIWQVKTWYKATFQNGNRWNRSMIRSNAQNYTEREVEELRTCFELLFDCQRNYNLSFIKFIDQLVAERQGEKTGRKHEKLRIKQKAYYELLRIMGEQKTSGDINNTYKQLAAIIEETFLPEDPIKPSTIIDRLKNQKGYK